MRTKPLLAAALLAAGVVSSAPAQVPLPGDWDQKVSAVIQDAGRARVVTYTGRQYDEKRAASFAAMKAAKAELKAVFLDQASSVGDRRLSLNVFRDDRRKASVSAVDALLKVREQVSKKEWQEIWPEGYFTVPEPGPLLAVKLQEAIPAVVGDPARRKQAEEIAASLAKAAQSDEAARRKATARFSDLLARHDAPRDEFIELVNKLEESQMKMDEALIDGAGRLQAVLTPEEWASAASRAAAAAP